MDQDLAKYATRAVPRYTSYPTAPHFSDAVGSETYAGWLETLDPADPVSLYFHVPFCKELCWYCGCNMKLASRYEPIKAYVNALIDELDLLIDHLPARMKVAHIHWGGGTPTALLPDDLALVMEAAAKRFDILADAEIAIESDPRTLSDKMIDMIGLLGFNRASFGVQEFDPKVQAAINRIQPPEMVERCVESLREAGIDNINFDLIYGLPHQTTATIDKTIQDVARMRPNRVALFGYAHVPWMAKKQRLIDEAALPGAAERLAQAETAAAALVAAGYDAIGLDHFALPDDSLAIAARTGTLHRNFQGYTTDEAGTMLGLGATSIGVSPFGYVQNLSETGAWKKAVAAGRLPVGKGYAFKGQDKARAEVIEHLMCFGRVDLDAIAEKHALPDGWCAAEVSDLKDFIADGLATFDGRTLATTDKGRQVIRVLASAFDEHLTRGKARHSVAV